MVLAGSRYAEAAVGGNSFESRQMKETAQYIYIYIYQRSTRFTACLDTRVSFTFRMSKRPFPSCCFLLPPPPSWPSASHSRRRCLTFERREEACAASERAGDKLCMYAIDHTCTLKNAARLVCVAVHSQRSNRCPTRQAWKKGRQKKSSRQAQADCSRLRTRKGLLTTAEGRTKQGPNFAHV